MPKAPRKQYSFRPAVDYKVSRTPPISSHRSTSLARLKLTLARQQPVDSNPPVPESGPSKQSALQYTEDTVFHVPEQEEAQFEAQFVSTPFRRQTLTPESQGVRGDSKRRISLDFDAAASLLRAQPEFEGGSDFLSSFGEGIPARRSLRNSLRGDSEFETLSSLYLERISFGYQSQESEDSIEISEEMAEAKVSGEGLGTEGGEVEKEGEKEESPVSKQLSELQQLPDEEVSAKALLPLLTAMKESIDLREKEMQRKHEELIENNQKASEQLLQQMQQLMASVTAKQQTEKAAQPPEIVVPTTTTAPVSTTETVTATVAHPVIEGRPVPKKNPFGVHYFEDKPEGMIGPDYFGDFVYLGNRYRKTQWGYQELPKENVQTPPYQRPPGQKKKADQDYNLAGLGFTLFGEAEGASQTLWANTGQTESSSANVVPTTSAPGTTVDPPQSPVSRDLRKMVHEAASKGEITSEMAFRMLDVMKPQKQPEVSQATNSLFTGEPVLAPIGTRSPEAPRGPSFQSSSQRNVGGTSTQAGGMRTFNPTTFFGPEARRLWTMSAEGRKNFKRLPPKKFTEKDDWDEFIIQLECHLAGLDIQDEYTMVVVLSTFLEGAPQQKLKNMRKENPSLNYIEAKYALQSAFRKKVDRPLVGRDALKLTWDRNRESLHAFYERLVAKHQEAFVHFDTQHSQELQALVFQNAMPREWSSKMHEHCKDMYTASALFEYALQLEENEKFQKIVGLDRDKKASVKASGVAAIDNPFGRGSRPQNRRFDRFFAPQGRGQTPRGQPGYQGRGFPNQGRRRGRRGGQSQGFRGRGQQYRGAAPRARPRGYGSFRPYYCTHCRNYGHTRPFCMNPPFQEGQIVGGGQTRAQQIQTGEIQTAEVQTIGPAMDSVDAAVWMDEPSGGYLCNGYPAYSINVKPIGCQVPVQNVKTVTELQAHDAIGYAVVYPLKVQGELVTDPLIDSGAKVTIISKPFLQHINRKMQKNWLEGRIFQFWGKIVVFGGTVHKNIKKVVMLEVVADTKKATLPCLVDESPEPDGPFLLGENGMRALGFRLLSPDGTLIMPPAQVQKVNVRKIQHFQKTTIAKSREAAEFEPSLQFSTDFASLAEFKADAIGKFPMTLQNSQKCEDTVPEENSDNFGVSLIKDFTCKSYVNQALQRTTHSSGFGSTFDCMDFSRESCIIKSGEDQRKSRSSPLFFNSGLKNNSKKSYFCGGVKFLKNSLELCSGKVNLSPVKFMAKSPNPEAPEKIKLLIVHGKVTVRMSENLVIKWFITRDKSPREPLELFQLHDLYSRMRDFYWTALKEVFCTLSQSCLSGSQFQVTGKRAITDTVLQSADPGVELQAQFLLRPPREIECMLLCCIERLKSRRWWSRNFNGTFLLLCVFKCFDLISVMEKERAHSSRSKGEWRRLRKQNEWETDEDEDKMKRSRSTDKSRSKSKSDRDRSESEKRKRDRKGDEIERKLAKLTVPEKKKEDVGRTKEKYGYPRESIIHRRPTARDTEIRKLQPVERCLELERIHGTSRRYSPQPYRRVDNLLQYTYPIREDDEPDDRMTQSQIFRYEFPEYGGPGKKKLYFGNDVGNKSFCGPITFAELCDRGAPYVLGWQWYGYFTLTDYPADNPGEQRKVACYIDRHRCRSVFELDSPVCRVRGPMQLLRREEDTLQAHDFVRFQEFYRQQLTPRPPGIGRGCVTRERSRQDGRMPGISQTATFSTLQFATSAQPAIELEEEEEVSAVSDIVWTGHLLDREDRDVIHIEEEMDIEEAEPAMPPPRTVILKTPTSKPMEKEKVAEKKRISFSEEELAQHRQAELERGETLFQRKQKKKEEKKQRRKQKKREEREAHLRSVYKFRFEGKDPEKIPYTVEEYLKDPEHYDRQDSERAGVEYVPIRDLAKKTHQDVQEAIIRSKFSSLMEGRPVTTEPLEPLNIGPSASQKLEKTGEIHQAYLSEMPDSERRKHEKLDFTNTEVEEQKAEFFQNAVVKGDVGYTRIRYMFQCMDPRMTYQYREVRPGVIFAKPPERAMCFQDIPELQQNVPETIVAAMVMTPGIETAVLQETAGYQYRQRISEGGNPEDMPLEDPYKFILSHWIHFGWMPTLPACFTVVRCRTILKNMLEDLANTAMIGDYQYFTFDSEGMFLPQCEWSGMTPAEREACPIKPSHYGRDIRGPFTVWWQLGTLDGRVYLVYMPEVCNCKKDQLGQWITVMPPELIAFVNHPQRRFFCVAAGSEISMAYHTFFPPAMTTMINNLVDLQEIARFMGIGQQCSMEALAMWALSGQNSSQLEVARWIHMTKRTTKDGKGILLANPRARDLGKPDYTVLFLGVQPTQNLEYMTADVVWQTWTVFRLALSVNDRFFDAVDKENHLLAEAHRQARAEGKPSTLKQHDPEMWRAIRSYWWKRVQTPAIAQLYEPDSEKRRNNYGFHEWGVVQSNLWATCIPEVGATVKRCYDYYRLTATEDRIRDYSFWTSSFKILVDAVRRILLQWTTVGYADMATSHDKHSMVRYFLVEVFQGFCNRFHAKMNSGFPGSVQRFKDDEVMTPSYQKVCLQEIERPGMVADFLRTWVRTSERRQRQFAIRPLGKQLPTVPTPGRAGEYLTKGQKKRMKAQRDKEGKIKSPEPPKLPKVDKKQKKPKKVKKVSSKSKDRQKPSSDQPLEASGASLEPVTGIEDLPGPSAEFVPGEFFKKPKKPKKQDTRVVVIEDTSMVPIISSESDEGEFGDDEFEVVDELTQEELELDPERIIRDEDIEYVPEDEDQSIHDGQSIWSGMGLYSDVVAVVNPSPQEVLVSVGEDDMRTPHFTAKALEKMKAIEAAVREEMRNPTVSYQDYPTYDDFQGGGNEDDDDDDLSYRS